MKTYPNKRVTVTFFSLLLLNHCFRLPLACSSCKKKTGTIWPTCPWSSNVQSKMRSDDNEFILKKELQTTSQALQSIIHVSNFELSRSTHRHKLSYRGNSWQDQDPPWEEDTQHSIWTLCDSFYFIIFSPFCSCYCSISFVSRFPTSSWE